MNVKDAGVAFYGATNKHNEINSDNENVQGKKKGLTNILIFQ